MLCISITEKTTERIIEAINSDSYGDLYEIRYDLAEKADLKRIISSVKTQKPLLITNRRKSEGGNFSGSESERISILETAIRLRADYIDIEFSSGKQAIQMLKALAKKTSAKTKIILSYHNFKETPENIDEIYSKMKKENCDIIKIVTYANSINNNLKIFNLLQQKKNLIAFCMGERGQLSRIFCNMKGSFMTYASISDGKESASGQITAKTLKDIYKIDSLNRKTKIYGLVGNPVSESKGYLIHNKCFQKLGLDNVYVNFLVDDVDDFFSGYKEFFSGLSVTMPHKQVVMKYLDDIDESAKKINAVNTIEVKNGKLIGHNTDVYGAIQSIKDKTTIKGKNCLMLGAGGVARAIAYGVLTEGGKLFVSDSDENKARGFADEFKCKYIPISEIKKINCEVLINATPIGMFPNVDSCVIEENLLKKDMVVFDVVYNPAETKLIRMAKKKGCKVVYGLDMFIYQAVKQFELWTGKKAPIEVMRKIISIE